LEVPAARQTKPRGPRTSSLDNFLALELRDPVNRSSALNAPCTKGSVSLDAWCFRLTARAERSKRAESASEVEGVVIEGSDDDTAVSERSDSWSQIPDR